MGVAALPLYIKKIKIEDKCNKTANTEEISTGTWRYSFISVKSALDFGSG